MSKITKLSLFRNGKDTQKNLMI